MDTTDKRIYIGGLLAFILTNFHLLRNVSPAFPAATLLVLGVTTAALFWRGLVMREGARIALVALAACMGYAILISFVAFPEESYADKIPRFLLTVPFLFIGAMLNRSQLRVFLLVSACFGALGGLSLVVQNVAGPIGWFAEASERGGLVRYSSVLGSLTILGIFAGMALSAAYFCRTSIYLKFLFIFLIAIGCVLSLQKAAIVNLVLFLLLVCVYEAKNKRYLIIGMSFTGIFLAGIVLSLFFGDYFDLAVNLFSGSNTDVVVDDVSVVESLLMRMWELPSKLFATYGVNGMLFGVGMVGGAGSLGFPDYPMAHNVFFDMLFIGGIPLLLIYCFLLVTTIARLYRLRTAGGDVELASLWCMMFYLINLPAASGIQFQPVISSVIYLIIGFFFISPLRMKVRAHV